jgi:hypothetical protein
VQGPGIANRSLQGVRRARRPLEAVGNEEEPDRLGAVLGLVVVGLSRTWTKQGRKRGMTLTGQASAMPQATSEEGIWGP